MMKKRILKTLSFIWILTLCTEAFPQVVEKYTLDDVIDLALQQSPDALIAKHTYLRSYWSFRSFKAKYLPGVNLDARLPNLDRSIKAVLGQDGSTIFTPQNTLSFAVDLSVNQKIGFSGGEVFLTSGIERLDNTINDTTSTQYLSNMINLGINQPIFKYNEYKWDKILEPMRFQEAQRLFVETREQVSITAVDRFFSLLMGQIEVEIARKNKSNYDTLYRIALGRYNLGKIAENDLLQLELNLLKAEAAVENTELNYENRLFEFKSYLRLKDSTQIELIPPVSTPQFTVPAEKAIIEARNNTSAGLEFQRRIIEAESELNRAKREGRFDADLFASFGLTQTSYEIQTAYTNPLDQEHVTLGISVPLLDWGKARGNIKMAESNLLLVTTSVDQEKVDFEQNIFINVMQFNMQEKQLRIAAKSDTVAQKRFTVTQQRYMIGMVNDVLELNNAQIDNDNAKIGYYRALMNYWQSFYGIRKLTLYDFQRDMPIMINFDSLDN